MALGIRSCSALSSAPLLGIVAWTPECAAVAGTVQSNADLIGRLRMPY